MTDTSTTAVSPSVEACKRDRMKMILAIAAFAYLILVTLIYAYCLARGIKIDGEAAGALGLLAGVAISNVKDVFGFTFGSSQGSEDKSTQITALSNPPPTQA